MDADTSDMEFEINEDVDDATTEEILDSDQQTIERANSESSWEEGIDIKDLFSPSPPPTFPAELNTVEPEFDGSIQKRLRNCISNTKARVILTRCPSSFRFRFPTRTSKALVEHECNLHSAQHDKRVKFSCVTCDGRNFIDQKSRDEHLKQYHINNVSVQLSRVQSLVECPHCTRRFLVQKDLSAHVESEHTDLLEIDLLSTTAPLVGTKAKLESLPKCPHCDCSKTEIKATVGQDSRTKCPHCCDDKSNGEMCLTEYISKLHQKTLQCLKCPLTLASRQALNEHVMVVHERDKALPCLTCKSRNETSRVPVFPTQARLAQHVRLYHNPASLQKCPHCDKYLRTKWHLKQHIEINHLDGPKPHCRDCNKKFPEPQKLRDHIIQIHVKQNKTAKNKNLQTQTKEKQLGDCDNESEIETNAKNRCEPSPRPRVQCPRCLSTFSNTKHLQFHIMLQHVQKKEFPCLICTSRDQGRSDTEIKGPKCIFKDEYSLNQHMKHIHYTRRKQSKNPGKKLPEKVRILIPKNKVCPICAKAFDGKWASSNYRSHMRTHLGVKRHSCEHCSKKFSSKLSFHAHLIRYHNFTSDQLNFKFACKICKFITMTQSVLNYHMGRKHPYDQLKLGDQLNVNPETEPNQSHGNSNSKNKSSTKNSTQSAVCFVCSKIQTSKRNLDQHLKEHRGEGRFYCDICPRDYCMRMPLLTHLRMDHHKLAYCSKCLTSFADAAAFNKHILHVAAPALNSNASKKVISPAVSNLKCEICSQSFKSPCLFKIHTISHLKEFQQQESNFPDDEVVSTRNIFKCSVCSSTFDRQSYLNAHLEIVHESPVYSSRFMCDKCEKNYKFASELKNHDLVVHSPKINQHINQNQSDFVDGALGFECDVCTAKFGTESELTDHQDKFRSEVLCHMCAIKFRCNAFLEIHLKRVHKQTDNCSHKYLCHVCPSTFFDGLGLRRHVERLHEGKCKKQFDSENVDNTIETDSATFRNQNSKKQVSATAVPKRRISHGRSKNKAKKSKKSLACHVCSKIQTTKGNLMLHLKEHRGERRAFCDLCPRDYFDRFYLMAHLKLDHHKLAYCSKCFTSFADKFSIKQHALQVNENPDSPSSNFKCKLCDESSKSLCLFKIHTISHMKEIQQQELSLYDEIVSSDNSFKCSRCPSAFDRQSYLNAHLEIVHEISPDSTFFHCGKCERKYKSQNELKSHDLVVHSWKINQDKNQNQNLSDTPRADERGFECSICSSKFLTKSELTHHEGVFQSKLACHICSTKFNCKSNLRAHMERMHRGKHLVCGICLVKFSRDLDLKKHVRQVHERKKIAKK